nr:hypothetical protein [Tanacetum cinerariifolium]
MPKHRLDESPSFSLGPEFDDFSIEQINQTNFKDESRVAFSETESHCSQKEKQSFDRIQTVFFQAESEIDVLKEDIKPDIKDASIRVQPKRDSSIAWYLKSPFKTGKVVIIDNSSVDDNLTTRQRYFKLPQELISVFDKYLSKNSPERHASVFRNVEPERMKMIWRTNENELDSGVFL